MSTTFLSDVSDQVMEFWSPLFVDELKEQTLLPSLVNKDYEGDIKKGGDTVHVSQINRPTAERKTISSGADTFASQKLVTQRISIVADQRITASFEFEDVVDLQSQIGDENPKIRQALLESVEIELNNFLYGIVAPSAATPDHIITSVTDFNAAQLGAVRVLAAQAKWMRQDGWWVLADPQYFQDLLDASTMTSSDFVPDAPVVGGQISRQRFGFNILEDNSAGLLSLQAGTQDAALAFHPDFLNLVMQREPTFKVSDLHSNHQHGFLISVDMIVGASLGNDGDVKHITIIDS